jgi:hypothetical protein
MEFTISRIYSDAAGDSHFEDQFIPLRDSGVIGYLSEGTIVTEVYFRYVQADYDYDFHTAPQKQLVVLLDGAVEIETSLGDKRVFQSGTVLLLEDTQGKGHKTKNVANAKRKSLFITIP